MAWAHPHPRLHPLSPGHQPVASTAAHKVVLPRRPRHAVQGHAILEGVRRRRRLLLAWRHGPPTPNCLGGRCLPAAVALGAVKHPARCNASLSRRRTPPAPEQLRVAETAEFPAAPAAWAAVAGWVKRRAMRRNQKRRSKSVCMRQRQPAPSLTRPSVATELGLMLHDAPQAAAGAKPKS